MAAPKASSRGAIRWRPTREQLMILEELFKGGIKCPTSHQVQKITTKLKEHGKVESKNVFYWFQNHKAREKQKLRKKLDQLQVNKDFVYYNIYPQPHFACGFWPMFPAQVINGQIVSSTANLVTGTQEDGNPNESSWLVTWLTTDNHHKNRPLETLQLFPTTTETTTSSTGVENSATSSSNMCSSCSGVLISL